METPIVRKEVGHGPENATPRNRRLSRGADRSSPLNQNHDVTRKVPSQAKDEFSCETRRAAMQELGVSNGRKGDDTTGMETSVEADDERGVPIKRPPPPAASLRTVKLRSRSRSAPDTAPPSLEGQLDELYQGSHQSVQAKTSPNRPRAATEAPRFNGREGAATALRRKLSSPDVSPTKKREDRRANSTRWERDQEKVPTRV